MNGEAKIKAKIQKNGVNLYYSRENILFAEIRKNENGHPHAWFVKVWGQTRGSVNGLQNAVMVACLLHGNAPEDVPEVE